VRDAPLTLMLPPVTLEAKLTHLLKGVLTSPHARSRTTIAVLLTS